MVFLFIKSISNNVKADMGPKPSITIKVNNIYTDNYIIDLLVYDETGEKYRSPEDYNGEGLTEEQIRKLHSINYDGWISESTRWSEYLLFAECAGPGNKFGKKYEHTFSYFGTPTTYKILLINNDNGEIKVSDVITRKDFTSIIELDVRTMKIKQSYEVNYIDIFICLFITVVIEILIALVMKIKHIKSIVIVNVITQILIQAFRIWNFNFIWAFMIAEILVFIIEYFIYNKIFDDIKNKDILIYTLIANITTALLTFSNNIIPFIVLIALFILYSIFNSKKI